MDSQEKINIVCWKWNPIAGKPNTKKYCRFHSGHVNALFEMLKKHVRLPFRLLCVTEDPVGIDPNVEIVPLWDEFRDLGGCFVRLSCFKKGFDLFGKRFISLDLDCVIVDDVTELFTRSGDFIIWDPEDSAYRISKYCGSLWALVSGTRSKVYDSFDPSALRPQNKGRYIGGTDQRHISQQLSDEKVFTQQDGVYNFVPDILLGQKGLPNNAKIVFFNGRFLPDDSFIVEKQPWIKEHYPLAGTGIVDYDVKKAMLRLDRRKDLAEKRGPVRKKQHVPKEKINFISYLWGDWPGEAEPVSGIEYAQVLFQALRANANSDFAYRYILYSDKEISISGVEVRKLEVPEDLRWNLKKMFMFSPSSNLDGPCICFDLDCMILGSLDPLLKVMFNWNSGERLITCEAAYQKGEAGGSVVGFYPSRILRRKLWGYLMHNRSLVEKKTKGSERFFYRQQLEKGEMIFWEDRIPGAIASYKRDCGSGMFPTGSHIVRFHGFPRPHQVQDVWVKKYWREYGLSNHR